MQLVLDAPMRADCLGRLFHISQTADVDSLNESELKKGIKDSLSLVASINILEQWFIDMGVSSYEKHIKFLRDLQKLRSTGSSHRKGKEYEKAAAKFDVTGRGFLKSFEDILVQSNAFLAFLNEMATHSTCKTLGDSAAATGEQ